MQSLSLPKRFGALTLGKAANLAIPVAIAALAASAAYAGADTTFTPAEGEVAAIAAEGAMSLVEDISSSVLRNPGALISLAQNDGQNLINLDNSALASGPIEIVVGPDQRVAQRGEQVGGEILVAQTHPGSIDLPAHGLTGPWPKNGDYSLDGYARFVDRFADRIALNRFALAGNSMGVNQISEELQITGKAFGESQNALHLLMDLGADAGAQAQRIHTHVTTANSGSSTAQDQAR